MYHVRGFCPLASTSLLFPTQWELLIVGRSLIDPKKGS